MTGNFSIAPFVVPLLLGLSACGQGTPAATTPEANAVTAAVSDHDVEGEEGNEIHLSAEDARAAGITVSQVTMSGIADQLSLPAEIRFDADRVANVSPQVSGVIRQLYVSEGQSVELGDRLARLSSRELADMKSDYLSALNAERVAVTVLNREEKLWEDQITSEADLLNARAVLRSATTARESAENKLHAVGIGHQIIDILEQAEDGALSDYAVTAPIAGLVVRRSVTLGETVVSGEGGGEAMFTIVDDSVVWVDIAVFKQDLGVIGNDNPVRLMSQTGGILARGKIAFISPIIDETSRTATARVIIPNDEGTFRPGQFVTAEIETGSRREAILVPLASVQIFDGEQVVFVPSDEGFAPRTVTTGAMRDGLIEITGGLIAEERFVNEGAFTLKAQLEKDDFGDSHDH